MRDVVSSRLKWRDKLDADRLLVLLPRCKKREARSHIMDELEGKTFMVLTVSGGEKAIKERHPALI